MQGPLTLVDSGWASPHTHAALERGLATLGSTSAEITRIVVTHAHHDHYTHALALRATRPLSVLLGRGEKPTVETFTHTSVAPQVAMLHRAGAPALADAMAAHDQTARATDTAPWDNPDHWLEDGDIIDLGVRQVQVQATPGHTRGHIVLRDDANAALFAADHVLPNITPLNRLRTSPGTRPAAQLLGLTTPSTRYARRTTAPRSRAHHPQRAHTRR